MTPPVLKGLHHAAEMPQASADPPDRRLCIQAESPDTVRFDILRRHLDGLIRAQSHCTVNPLCQCEGQCMSAIIIDVLSDQICSSGAEKKADLASAAVDLFKPVL